MIPNTRPLILVVEDDDTLRQTMADILDMNGFDCRLAADGLAGLRLAQQESPSVILTDIQMPGLTGFELLRKFRENEQLRTIPVIVISAKVDRAAMRKGMELGAADFITKPFTEEEVILSIRARLEKKELIDELDAFGHTVAHDLKNPLGALKGRLEILEMNLGKGDAQMLQKQVTEAKVAADRLDAIIEELLVLAGVRQQSVEPRPLDTGAIVEEALRRLEDLIRRRGATVSHPNQWPPALGFQPWVVHVWSNYISNAARYGGPNARITLGAEVRPGRRAVRFWVQDQGPGMDAAAQASLFVPFTRISSIRLTGHGLGLSIVRRIVEKLGGSAGVDSEPGKGSRFGFDLPIAAGPTVDKPSASS
jgi:signal transduction histidine kinase